MFGFLQRLYVDSYIKEIGRKGLGLAKNSLPLRRVLLTLKFYPFYVFHCFSCVLTMSSRCLFAGINPSSC